MRITLFGHGRMGCAVEKLAPSRGHEIINIVDPKYSTSEPPPGKNTLSEAVNRGCSTSRTPAFSQDATEPG